MRRAFSFFLITLPLVLLHCRTSTLQTKTPETRFEWVRDPEPRSRGDVPGRYVLTFATSGGADERCKSIENALLSSAANALKDEQSICKQFVTHTGDRTEIVNGAQLDRILQQRFPRYSTESFDFVLGSAFRTLGRNQLTRVEELPMVVPFSVTNGDPDQCAITAIGGPVDADFSVPHVAVLIVDSGVALDHPDLEKASFDPGTTTENPDQFGHGTHLVGLIGAVPKMSGGIAGIAPGVPMYVRQFLDARGRGRIDDAITKLRTAISQVGQTKKVVLLSWGTISATADKWLRDEVLKSDRDILFVAAAGNNGRSDDDKAVYPAHSSVDLDNVLTVMATTCADKVPRFSNFGAQTVQLAAPGDGTDDRERIVSTVLDQQKGQMAGTSMAAAYVAGAAALVWQKNPNCTAAQLRSLLINHGDSIPALTGLTTSGKRLNVAKSLAAPPCQ